MLLDANRRIQLGFTLLEVSIVLLIVGLLLAGGVNLMSASGDTARYKETQGDIQEVKDALMTYYTQYHMLPCPDIDNNPASNSFGVSDYGGGSTVPPIPVTGGVCTNNEGWLPHVTLGVGGNGDAWGQRIRYVVNGAFMSSTNAANFCSSAAAAVPYSRSIPANQVQIQDLTIPAPARVLGDWAGFALLSTGKDGLQTNAGMTGAFTGNGGCAALDIRQRANCTASNTPTVLRYGDPLTDGATVTFDDMVVWVGDMQLISLYRQSGSCLAASNNNNNNNTPTPNIDPTARTTTNFTANPGQAFNGNYENGNNANTSNAADKVTVGGNLEQAINLQDGNNTLSITGNAEANITAGSGNDIVRVQGNLQRAVNLGAGDDYLEVWGNTTGSATVDMGAGNDSVRIEGNVSATIELGSGTNSIYVGGNINAPITATGGTATVYYEGASMSTAEKTRVSGLTPLLCRAHTTDPWSACA